MTNESKIIIAFVFKRSGKTEITPSEFYLNLSIDLKWFKPEEAKEVLNQILKQKLVVKKGDKIKPSFDYNKVNIPVGFYPSKTFFENKEKPPTLEKLDLIGYIIKKINEKTGVDKKTITEKIQSVEKEKNIKKEVAALLVGKYFDIPLEDFFDDAETKIFKENKE